MKLEDITKDALLEGIVPGSAVAVMMVEPIGFDSLQIYFERSDRTLRQRIHFHKHETTVDFGALGHTWSCNALGDKYFLAAEAGKSPKNCRQHNSEATLNEEKGSNVSS